MIESLLGWLRIHSGWPTFRTGKVGSLPEVLRHPRKREFLLGKLDIPINTILTCFRLPFFLAAAFVEVAVTIL